MDKVERVKAWEALIAHPLIRKDIATLTSVRRILDNSEIAGIISKTDLQITVQKLAEKGVRCRTCQSGNPSYKYLDEILDDLEHGASKFGNPYAKVIADIKKGGSFTEGAMWIADGVRKYPNEFPAGTTLFEEVIEGGVRRVDVRVGDKFYEFKSNATPPLYGFDVEQFVKDMDLSEVTDLNQIKWWFDGKKVASLPKQQFLDQLQNATIDQATINKLVKSGPKTKQALLDLIDDNFNTILSTK